MAEGINGLILKKLEQIEEKQDLAADLNSRMDERQQQMYRQLASGAQTMQKHDARIDALETFKTRAYTVLGVFGAIWASVVGVVSWFISHFPFPTLPR